MIVERKINREILFKYNVGFCIEGKYGGRIVIPSYTSNGELNYFLTRAFRRGMKPPYLNPKVDKDKIIFNEGLINWDSTLYIVEGIFEVFSFPVNSVPMLGKTISNAMFMKLNEKKPPVVILLDPDAFTNAIEMFQKLQGIYVGHEDKLRIVELPGKNDLDEIRRKMGVHIMNRFIQGARPLKLDDLFKIKKYEEGKRYYSYSGYKSW
jgi:DNA primase